MNSIISRSRNIPFFFFLSIWSDLDWEKWSKVFHYCFHLFLLVPPIISAFINIVATLFSTEVFRAVTSSFWFVCFDTIKCLYYCFLAWFLPSLIFYYNSHFLFVLLFPGMSLFIFFFLTFLNNFVFSVTLIYSLGIGFVT